MADWQTVFPFHIILFIFDHGLGYLMPILSPSGRPSPTSLPHIRQQRAALYASSPQA